MFKVFGILLAILATGWGVVLPDFIIKCNKDDPKLNECALKNANIAVPRLVKGYRPYNLPKLSPLYIPKIQARMGSNLNVDLTDNHVYGLEQTTVKDVDMQLDKRHLVFKVHIPKASISGHYKMNGQILILPIKGEGTANGTLMEGDYIYNMDYELIPKNGTEYLSVSNHSIIYNTTRVYFHFDNLFNGNGQLGEQMNKFLDENWEVLAKEMESTIAEIISSIITSIAQNIFTQIPFDQIFDHN